MALALAAGAIFFLELTRPASFYSALRLTEFLSLVEATEAKRTVPYLRQEDAAHRRIKIAQEL